jgi:hypothetical protein
MAIAFTVICYPLWQDSDSGWHQIVIDVVPSMLGFSMGGMAIVLAFATSKSFSILAENGAKDSFFIKLIAAFFHFILVQAGAILVVVLAKAFTNIYISRWIFLVLLCGACRNSNCRAAAQLWLRAQFCSFHKGKRLNINCY